MFIKNITEPLQHMIESSKEISKGDLSQTINIQSTNELADLGHVINEMSSNLQEIILLSKNMGSAGMDFIKKTSSTLKHPELSHNDINRIGRDLLQFKKNVELLNDAVDFFNFYAVKKKTDE